MLSFLSLHFNKLTENQHKGLIIMMLNIKSPKKLTKEPFSSSHVIFWDINLVKVDEEFVNQFQLLLLM